MSAETERIRLASGRHIPVLGLGTLAPLQGEEEIIDAVKAAVRAGYRHIDCAAIYRNERAVGHALKELIVMGVVQREDLFITSKLWNTCHIPELVVPSLKKTLDDLFLDYVDLYLIHWPMAYKEGGELNPLDENGKTYNSDTDYVDTWQAMEDCRDMGLTKDIGISNFNKNQIQRVLDSARLPPVVLQVEVNCHITNSKLIEFAKSKNITVVAYAPLGAPFIDHSETKLLDEPILKEIAGKYGKSPAQIALRFVIQQGIAVIPKSVNSKRIEENSKVFDFKISDEDIARLAALNRNYRGYAETIALDHPHYPFYDEY